MVVAYIALVLSDGGPAVVGCIGKPTEEVGCAHRHPEAAPFVHEGMGRWEAAARSRCLSGA